ncbi:hypothetical protein EVAR_52055_1 [Eumeta japonica]|uniref:Uncharacterized protein n=1 Tax=Eumeta variegata TaxID=151549 RepID=A0A4C1Z820_EUMVA|nr:hypothetical protein EVAR_52055_1 [Eumeta japonica]
MGPRTGRPPRQLSTRPRNAAFTFLTPATPGAGAAAGGVTQRARRQPARPATRLSGNEQMYKYYLSANISRDPGDGDAGRVVAPKLGNLMDGRRHHPSNYKGSCVVAD